MRWVRKLLGRESTPSKNGASTPSKNGASTPSKSEPPEEHALALLEAGIAKARTHQWAGAAEDFRRATQLDTNLTDAFDNAKIATKGGPDSVARLLNLGNTAVRAGELDRAGDAYRAALSLSPNDATIHGNLGILHYQKAQWDQAVEHLVSATKGAADSSAHLIALAA